MKMQNPFLCISTWKMDRFTSTQCPILCT